MPEIAIEAPPAAAGSKRLWFRVVVTGFVLAMIAMLTVLLVMVDKPHFGWMVNWMFLPAITSGVLVGGALMTIGSLMMPERKTWKGIAIIVWGLIATTSPIFGFLFLAPWSVLAVTTPLVIWILMGMRAR